MYYNYFRLMYDRLTRAKLKPVYAGRVVIEYRRACVNNRIIPKGDHHV